MPTYEYRCPKGHQFELFQRMSDEPRARCPTCDAEAQRLLSAGAGFLFKGDGFYITDYRSESYQKEAKAEKGDGGSKKADQDGSTPMKKSDGDSSGASKSPAGSSEASAGSGTTPSKKSD